MAPAYFDRLDYIYKLLVIIALSLTAVILCRDIVIPLAFAIFLAIVMLPLVNRLEKHIGLITSVSLAIVGTIIVLGLLGWVLVNQIISFTNDLPALEQKFVRFIEQMKLTISQYFDTSGFEPPDRNKMAADLAKGASGYIGALLLSTTNTLSTLVQIPIYLFLLLIYKNKFRVFFASLIPGDDQDFTWKKEIENVIQGYISGLALVTLIVSALNTIGLLALGIDHAIFFGILSGILTIIPYVGIFIGALFPTLMALITKDSAWYAVGVVAVFSIVQFLEGNLITPRITGSKVSINALAAILALLVGGKILGIAGMILAIPAIGTLKIVFAYSSHLKPFVILLGDEGDEKNEPEEQPPPPKTFRKKISDLLIRKGISKKGSGK